MVFCFVIKVKDKSLAINRRIKWLSGYIYNYCLLEILDNIDLYLSIGCFLLEQSWLCFNVKKIVWDNFLLIFESTVPFAIGPKRVSPGLIDFIDIEIVYKYHSMDMDIQNRAEDIESSNSEEIRSIHSTSTGLGCARFLPPPIEWV